MPQIPRRVFWAACTAAALLPSAWAQNSYPEKNVSLVVAYPAGGPTDSSARSIQPVLQREFKQTVLVENIGGAGGTLAITRVMGLPADGYQIMVCTPSETVLAPLALTSAKHKPEDLRMVAQLSYTHMVLVSRTNLGLKTFEEFAAHVRDPAKKELAYGSFGVGSVAHLMFEDLRSQINGKLTHVPYKGTGPMIQDLAGGQVDVGFVPLIGMTLDMIKGGKLYPLFVTDNKRSPSLPAVPAAGEITALKNFEYTIWGGVFVPRATPEPVVARISAAVNAALKDPEYRKITEGGGATVSPAQTLDQASKLYRSETEKYLRIAKAIKLEPQ